MSQSRQTGSRSIWIAGPVTDLSLMVLTPLLVLFAFEVTRRLGLTNAFVAFGLTTAVGHYLPGMIRAYGDRSLFRRFRVRLIVVPLLLISLCAGFAWLSLHAVTFVMLMWGSWHWMMQIYGFARIYDSKAGSVGATAARFDYWICILWFVGIIACLNGEAAEHLRTFYRAGGPTLSPEFWQWFRNGWMAVTVTASVAYVIRSAIAARRGDPPALLKLLVFSVSLGYFWYTTSNFVATAIIGYVLFEMFHDIQYLTLVWLVNCRRAEQNSEAGSFLRFLFRRRWWLVASYAAICLLFGASQFAIPAITDDIATRIGMSLISAVAIFHYYLDGFIWKIRDLDNSSALGVDAKQSRSWSPNQRRHVLLWSVLLLGVGLLAFSQLSGQAVGKMEMEQNVAAAFPGNMESRLYVCGVLESAGAFSEATEWCDEAEALAPDSPRIHQKYALLAIAREDYFLAEQYAKKLLKVLPDNFVANYCQGLVFARRGRYEEAIKCYETALAARPESADTHNNLGTALMKLERADAAEPHYRLAVKFALTPEARFLTNLAAAQLTNGKYAEAEVALNEAVSIDPEFVPAHFNLGRLALQTGRDSDALAHFHDAVSRDPHFVPGHLAIAAQLASSGKVAAATEHLKGAIETNPKQPQLKQMLKSLEG